jgi:hypothetical protein
VVTHPPRTVHDYERVWCWSVCALHLGDRRAPTEFCLLHTRQLQRHGRRGWGANELYKDVTDSTGSSGRPWSWADIEHPRT